MRVLVWQWGRRGAGPLVAAATVRALAAVPGVETVLSLSTGAELLGLPGAPANDLPVRTYSDQLGFLLRLSHAPWFVPKLAKAIRAARVDVALCAMPAPMDFAMAAALRRAGVPYAVVVHDAHLHPGDSYPMQIGLQRHLVGGAGLLFALSTHVAEQLRQRGLRPGQCLLQATLPPFVFGPGLPPVGEHGGRGRVLSFGRLLPYKGLDLLADAMERLGGAAGLELRVVGSGPDSLELARLRALPHVTVENRWVPEAELHALLGWADALVLTHREASQSGVAAAAIAARRWVVSTDVGGLAEQLRNQTMAVLCRPNADSIAAALGELPQRMAEPVTVAAEPEWDGGAVMAEGLRRLLPGVSRTSDADVGGVRPAPV